MRVVYRKPILERINEAVEAAENAHKPIEKIVLTHGEAAELWDACHVSVLDSYPSSRSDFLSGKCNAVVCGVAVEVEKK